MNFAPRYNSENYCCYCGRQVLYPLRRTAEHLVPTSKGGTNNSVNKRLCCHVCNSERGNKWLHYWLIEVMEAYNKPGADKYFLEAKIENIKYWIYYIETAGSRLYKYGARTK